MVQLYLAPCLIAGYENLTSEGIKSVAKESTRAAAVSIVDGTYYQDSLSNVALKTAAGRPTRPTTSAYQATPPKAEEPILNFLGIDFRPDNTGLHLTLLYQLEDICKFIDKHLGTFPNKREAQEDQDAAFAFASSDDEVFCGESVLAITGDKPILPSGEIGRILLIHGRETKATRNKPAFVGIAYLMRRWGKGFKETYGLVTAYNAKHGGGKIALTNNQHRQLLLWETTGYCLTERGTLGGRFLKRDFADYRRSKSLGN